MAFVLCATAWAQTNAVSTFVGTTGVAGFSNTSPGTFNFTVPSGVAIDSTGNLFVADATNNVIRKVTPAGVITTFAGSATGVAGSADGTGTAASFTSPQGIAIDGSNNLYVADTGNHAIRMITPAGVVTTLAGTAGGVAVASGNLDGTGTAARFNSPLGITTDRVGPAVNVYVADTQNNNIRQIVVATKAVTTIAGSTTGASGNTNDVGTLARFFHPDSIVSDAVSPNILYVADTFNHLIRKIVLPAATVTTLAGSGAAGYAEGTTTAAVFNQPAGIAMSGANVIVSDTSNHVIRTVTTAGVTTLLAGTPTSSGSTDGLATAAKFNVPTGLFFDSGASKTYVIDTNNKTIRVIAAATAPTIGTQPANQSVASGGTATFTVSASGNPTVSYQWQVSTDSGLNWTNLTNGTGGVSGATTSTLSITGVTVSQSGNQYRVVVSNGVNPNATSTAASLTVTQVPAFTSATSTTFLAGQSNIFQVAVTGSPAPTVSATIPTAAAGWLAFNTSTKQLIGTPPDATTPYTITFTATNSAGTTNQTFTLNVSTNTPPVLSGPAATTQLAAGGTTATFTVTVTGGTPTDFTYQWQRNPGGVGSFADIANGTSGNLTFAGATTVQLSVSGISPNENGDQYRVVVKNNNSGTPNTTISTLSTLRVPPNITSAATASFTVGSAGSAPLAATGTPSPTFSIVSGTLPSGVTLSGNVLGGTPAAGTAGSYTLGITASNSGGTSATQTFVLTVNDQTAPQITSPSSATFTVGQSTPFTFTASGSPTPTITLSGNLPDGVTFTTPVLGGTPTSVNGSPFTFTVTADNGVAPAATQTFTLTIVGVAPTFTTQPGGTTGVVKAVVGGTATFTAVATGSPTPSLKWQRQQAGTSGWVDLTDDGVFSGTSSTSGSGTLTINVVTSAMNGDLFRAVATNASGSAGTIASTTSSSARLEVDLGTIFSTFAGSPGVAGTTNGTGTAARFNSPAGIAVGYDPSSGGQAIYVADSANHIIRKVTANGVVTTVAGRPGQAGSVDGLASEAMFNSPQGIAVNGIGDIYVADTFNHTIRVIATSGQVTTFAGAANSSGSLDGVGSAARFFRPTGIVVDSSGTVYVSDSSNHTIRRILSNGTVSVYAGVVGQSGYINSSTPLTARFNFPEGLAFDTSGNLYVADSLNHAIRKIASLGGVVTTVAGTGSPGSTDANGINASFLRPIGLTFDRDGNILVADTFNNTIRKITAAGDVSTIAGLAGQTGTADGAGSSARFNQPYGVAVDANANIYVADTRNHTIRRSGSAFPPSITTQPTSKLAAVGDAVIFTAAASGTPTPSYQWQRALADSPDVFLDLVNDGNISGVNTAQLTIASATAEMNNQRFRVVARNGVLPAATSEVATLTIGARPVFTSASSATFRAGEAGRFTVTVTSASAATFSLSNNPSWMTINPSTGVITGTPPDTSGSPITVTVAANNGVAATQTITFTILPAQVAPSFTTQPVSATVNQGDNVSFSVAVSGTAPFTYQWRRNGIAIPGATNAILAFPNVQPSAAGTYNVAVTNVVTTVVSDTVSLTVNTAPVFSFQPHSQIAVAGSSVTFTAPATGGNLSYQWRRNGVAIAGANGPTLTLSNITAADAGNYDVLVANPLGTVISSLAQLTIVTTPAAPVITAQPAARTALVGTSVTLSAAASGAPSPSYQWRKNGVALPGQTNPTLTFISVQTGDAANYDVVVSNSAGTVTSNPAGLRVITRSYAGIYFGSFSGGAGEFAIYVREDNTGVFLGYLPGSTAPIMSLNLLVGDAGDFSFTQNAIAATAAAADEPARAAALGFVSVNGNITDNGIIGSVGGAVNLALTGARVSDGGGTQSYAGFYKGGATTSSASIYTIVGADGRAFVVEQNATTSDGGRGTVTGAGTLSVSTSRSTITENISGGTITGSSTGAISANFSGGNDAANARQRLLNISSRARVATADSVAIAGFVISGEESKPVLIRAVGPTLSSLGVAGALASPRLELFRGSTSLAVNTGIGTNRAAVDAAGVAAGAFTLGAAGTDAAIVTTLAPGAYTAIVSSSTNTAGVALIEVYDLSAAAAGQKLLNISTRAAAGTAENTLIAGFVVPPGAAKRVLIRGVGPGLSAFGVTGVLAQPVLTLLNGSATVATNTNWRTSVDQGEIASASAQVGGFGLATNDSALLVTLPPGNYTAQVLGTGGTTGVALIEVYEVP